MSLLTYSGITTKVRAMQSHLICDRQFREMANLEDVRSAAEYLQKQPAYIHIFSNLEDYQLHRGYLEQLLTLSKYRDFTKLYHFSNLPQRKFLDFYFMHYEISIIKKCLRSVMSHQHADLDLSMFEAFFKKHSRIDFIQLAQADNLPELLNVLEGSPYYSLFIKPGDVVPTQLPTMFDYEMLLDLYYFKTIWKLKNKCMSKKEREILKQCFGCRLDLLNIQWIYRSKKYYSLSSADIYALLIPIQHRLKSNQIQAMAEANNLNDFFSALNCTYYGNLSQSELQEPPNVEALYEQILSRLYQAASRKNPYSVAVLDSYLYFKELELQKLITTIEGIRYGLKASDIVRLVTNHERGAGW